MYKIYTVSGFHSEAMKLLNEFIEKNNIKEWEVASEKSSFDEIGNYCVGLAIKYREEK